MDVYEKARELGNLLLESKEGKKLYDKRFIFDGDLDARRMLFEYSRYRENIQVKMRSGEMSEEELEKEQQIMKEKIDEVTSNPVIGDMIKAEEEFNDLVNQVMQVLRATIDGQIEGNGGCSGSCSSCGGCH